MKNLVISNHTYGWIEHCYGLITKTNEIFEVMIFEPDDHLPIYNCDRLCTKAIYEQRRHDLYKIGKKA